MQLSLYKFWGLRLLEFPIEILLKIVQHLPHDGTDLQNLRLTCRVLRDLSTVHMFTKITIPGNLDGLMRATEILCMEHIGKQIRDIEIPCSSLLPRAHLREWEDGSFVLRLPTTTGTKQYKISRCAGTFAVNVFRIFSVCAANLQRLKLRGMGLGDGYTTKQLAERADKAFVGGVVESLACLEFTALEELLLDFRDIGVLSSAWERFTSGSGATLEKSMQRIRKLVFDNNSVTCSSDKEKTGNFLALVSNLEIRSFTMNLSGDCETVPTAMAPLAMNDRLTFLELSKIRAVDNFTRVLRRMKCLRSFSLEWFALEPEQDRWAAIFDACLENTGLEYIYFWDVFYAGLDNCGDEGFCTPYSADVRAFRKIEKRVEHLNENPKTTRRSVGWDLCDCHALD